MKFKKRLIFLTMLQITMVMLALPSVGFSASVLLNWDPSPDADLVGYKVYYQANSSALPFQGTGAAEGNAPINAANTTTATVGGLDPGSSYYFAVTAYNTAGLESVYSNIIEIPESVPPVVTITSPSNNASVNGTVSISASASDNVGVTGVQFYVNGVLQATDTAAPYVFAWNTSSLSGGVYTVSAQALDAAGNIGQSGNLAVNVGGDTAAPTVSLTAPGSNVSVSGSVTVTASASDNVAVTKIEIYDNTALVFASNLNPASYAWNSLLAANGSHTLSAKAYDAAGNIGQSANVFVTVANAVNDSSAPTVGIFTLPASANSLAVPVSSLTATDNVGVTGYLITESATAPAAAAAGWTSTAPKSFSFGSAGARTAYAWAKDAAGNVSSSRSASVTITLADVSAPTVSTFTLPATAKALAVSVSSLSATDNVGVTGYLITESASAPAATAVGWTSTAPTSFTFAGAGARTAYAWAKDAAGNVSASRSAAVTITITLSDTTRPNVTAFTMSSYAFSRTVTVSKFTATDNVAVTGYRITESATAPSAAAAGWALAAPTKFTFSGGGTRTAYAWTKDGAGNVSASRSASVRIFAR